MLESEQMIAELNTLKDQQKENAAYDVLQAFVNHLHDDGVMPSTIRLFSRKKILSFVLASILLLQIFTFQHSEAFVTGGAATVALGQTDLTSGTSGTTATTLKVPVGLAFDSAGNLWVADDNNNRVLKYPSANLVTGGAATAALGQTDLTSGTFGTTATTLDQPEGLAFDSAGNLWVTDSNNNRVLKYPVPSTSSGGGGGHRGDNSPPSFTGTVFSENEYPLSIGGTGFSLLQHSNTIPTQTLYTREPVSLKLLIYENSGTSLVQHVALYTNLRGLQREIPNSDTSIIYEKGKQIQVIDPNGFFSDVKVSTKESNGKLEISFDMTFAKSMEKSDIILRVWDESRNSADTKIFDAVQVVDKVSLPQADTSSSVESKEIAQAITPSQDQSDTQTQEMLFRWAGYSSQSATDSEMLDVIGIQGSYIPHWVKKVFGQGIHDEQLNMKDFAIAAKYLHKVGIIK